jgi:hypothetical protein
MARFEQVNPSTESYWRSVILFGRNTATLKFALAKSLLEVASTEKTFVSLEELAKPYSQHIREHLKLSDKQGISTTSIFFDAHRKFHSGEMSEDEFL